MLVVKTNMRFLLKIFVMILLLSSAPGGAQEGSRDSPGGRRGLSSEKSQGLSSKKSSKSSDQNCTAVAGAVVNFEEHACLELQGLPGLITQKDLVKLQTSLVESCNNVLTCDQPGAFKVIDEAEILPELVDAFGDNFLSSLSTGDNDALRNFTCVVALRGRCNACPGGAVVLFESDTAAPATAARRRLVESNDGELKVLTSELKDTMTQHQEEDCIDDSGLLSAAIATIEEEMENYYNVAKQLGRRGRNRFDGALNVEKKMCYADDEGNHEADQRSVTAAGKRTSLEAKSTKHSRSLKKRGKKGSSKTCDCDGPLTGDFITAYIEDFFSVAEATNASHHQCQPPTEPLKTKTKTTPGPRPSSQSRKSRNKMDVAQTTSLFSTPVQSLPSLKPSF
jgi:hypothetical protein